MKCLILIFQLKQLVIYAPYPSCPVITIEPFNEDTIAKDKAVSKELSKLQSTRRIFVLSIA